MKTKHLKSFAIFMTVSCAIVSILDFYLAWARVLRGSYGWAFLFFILGCIMLYGLRINLKTLIAIKKYDDLKRKKVKRDNSSGGR